MAKQKIALLIDGDPVAFAGASSSEVVHVFDGMYINQADMDLALQYTQSYIESLKKELKADLVINTLSCESRRYWRHAVMPTYKGGRKGPKGPICLADLKNLMMSYWETERWDNMEADDILGILATDPNYLPDYKKIVVSIDKDMQTLPNVWIYNPDKDYQPWFNSKERADKFFLSQAIGGDTTDGYTGVYGVSVNSANAFLDDPFMWESYEHTFKSGQRKGLSETKWRKVGTSGCLWTDIVSLFLKAGQTEDDALANAQVARICRASDWDAAKSEVLLWTPKRDGYV